MSGPVPGPAVVSWSGVDPARVRSLLLWVRMGGPGAPVVRVTFRFKGIPNGWLWRCDLCGQWREPRCPHSKAAQAASRTLIPTKGNPS